MRTDEAGSFLEDDADAEAEMRDLLAKGASFSGHERNRTFLQRIEGGAVDYVDVSAVSGLDSLADGRSFAWLDFDHDGLRDVVVTNANEPRVQLFRNQMVSPHPVLALRLVGANRASAPSEAGAGNRDGIGARIEIEFEDRTRRIELRAGEGLAAQNSSELLVGVPSAVKAVRVHWPSGRETVHKRPKVAASGRTPLTLHEGN